MRLYVIDCVHIIDDIRAKGLQNSNKLTAQNLYNTIETWSPGFRECNGLHRRNLYLSIYFNLAINFISYYFCQ